jgi:DNA-binding NarL/FixJ family response regulator
MPIPFPARLLIADDHAVVRRGLRSILDSEPDLKVVAEAADGAEALDIVLSEEIDLAIIDVAMPTLTGLQATERIRANRPETRVLILSMYDRDQYLTEALACGASGYVLKQQADRDIVNASRAALRGETFVYPARKSAAGSGAVEGARVGVVHLTRRESEIAKLIGEGLTGNEIAEALVISPKTVERHRANILHKLGVRRTVDIARYAIRQGLVEP